MTNEELKKPAIETTVTCSKCGAELKNIEFIFGTYVEECRGCEKQNELMANVATYQVWAKKYGAAEAEVMLSECGCTMEKIAEIVKEAVK